MTGQGELQSTAKAIPKQGRNAGFAQVFNHIEHAQTLIEYCICTALSFNTFRELFQVHAH